MTPPQTPLEKFQELLRELFQLKDAAELDFGIYRILNLKRTQVEEFISDRLPAIVEEAFAQYASANVTGAKDRLAKLRAEYLATVGEAAFMPNGELVPNLRDTEKGREYSALLADVRSATVTDELKARVYNDLYSFFSRYYEDGDFITRRRIRYSGQEAYAVPYNGDEVMLHWATKDQYYVKTIDRFTSYRFHAGDYTVSFDVRRAEADEGNGRDRKRYYALAATEPLTWDVDKKTLSVYFEYRPLTSGEQKDYGKTEQQKPQKGLNEATARAILDGATEAGLKAQLARSESADAEVSLLARHLTRFTRRNTSDFFIHKNLRGFLEQELDYFLKSECLLLDELVNAEDPKLPQAHVLRARVARRIAGHIIDFLAQVEDFQKRLFEKRKFVLRSEYCLTLDRVPEEFWTEVLENEAQVAEWRDLFALDDLLKAEKKRKLDHAFLKAHPTLVIDTKHFSEDFKWRLLAFFDNLDDSIDGVLVKSENFQALNLLAGRYEGNVDCVYIDPPYNTGDSEILYKNEYLRATWLSLMENRVRSSLRLLSDDPTLFVAIDDFEMADLCEVIDKDFPSLKREMIVVNHHPQGGKSATLASTHEYMLACVLRTSARTLVGRRGGDGPEDRPFKRSGTAESNFRRRRPNSFYAVLVDPRTKAVVGIERPPLLGHAYPKSQTEEGLTRVYPLGNGEEEERVWRRSYEKCLPLVKAHKLICSERMTIYQHIETGERKSALFSNWIGSRYNAGTHGANLLSDILGVHNPFSYPKSIYTVEDALFAAGMDDESVCVDYFAGSGTTGHAVINLNREDGARRRFVLIEMGGYFDTVLLPRVKKVVFSPKWKSGKPSRQATSEEADRGPHVVAYARLESYEDSLFGIRVVSTREAQGVLGLFGDDYVLRYMLESETRGSASLLNVDKFKEPFDYKLTIQDGNGTRENPVDLVQTFNYLLGLDVRKMRQFQDEGRIYRAVLGDRRGKCVVVIWRSVKDIEGKKDALLKDRTFIEKTILPALLADGAKPDRLFVNGASFVKDAETIEPEFKRLMFAPLS